MILPKGFCIAGTHCGIKKNGKKDLSIFYSKKPCVAAGMFTINLFKAAPVIVSQKNIKNKIYAVIANSGCANACTGKKGINDAKKMCEFAASEFNIRPHNVVVASTGVIGQFLPMDKIKTGVNNLCRSVAESLSRSPLSAVEGIMTTDTFPKYVSSQFKIGGSTVRIWGCAKGSGMIEPNLATMLSFILTDAAIEKSALNAALKVAAEFSFNCLTVDGDTSTNDSLFVLANGTAGNRTISDGNDFEKFCAELIKICLRLTKMLASDGEGATKLITVNVNGAKTLGDARKIAKTVANSPLVKTAVFGNDANWGRILAAAGRSGARIEPAKMDIEFGKMCVFRQGAPVKFSETDAKKLLAQKEVEINIKLNIGRESIRVYTCDLTDGYIKVNASYRS